MIDTLAESNRLKSVGIAPEHAEALVRLVADAEHDLITRDYLESKLENVLAPLKTDLAVLKEAASLIKWIMGLLVAGVLALLLKTFLPS